MRRMTPPFLSINIDVGRKYPFIVVEGTSVVSDVLGISSGENGSELQIETICDHRVLSCSSNIYSAAVQDLLSWIQCHMSYLAEYVAGAQQSE